MEDARIIKGTLQDAQQFEVIGPPHDEKLIELVKSKEIIFTQEPAKTSLWTTLLTSFLPFLLLIGFMFL